MAAEPNAADKNQRIALLEQEKDPIEHALEEDVERLEQEIEQERLVAEQNTAEKLREISRLEVEKAVAAERALHRKDVLQREKDFGAKAMHELRNPLNGAKGTLDYLLTELKDQLTPKEGGRGVALHRAVYLPHAALYEQLAVFGQDQDDR